MGYRGMVIIDNEDFGEVMELCACIKAKAARLTDKLSNAEMAESRAYGLGGDDYEDDEPHYKPTHNKSRGRYGY